ncbi:MAG: hypothetical protein IJG37_00505 [Synergistaceae bacterium]|nr:hypothetical protein [Synergistaceae bacterium]
MEYDKATGRILSEITSETELEGTELVGLALIDDEDEIDTLNHVVKNGRLKKLSETESDRQERERIRREHQAMMQKRLNSMCREAIISILEDDEEELKNLRREYRRMKSGV